MVQADVTATAVQLSMCEDGTWCPRNQDDVNTACCDKHEGTNVQLSGANIAASVVNSIQQRLQATAPPSPSATLPQASGSPSSTAVKGDSEEYTKDQQIALGVGIGLGLPTLIVAIIGLWMKCIR